MTQCPQTSCSNLLDENKAMNSMSRRDSSLYICNDCGVQEALQDHFSSPYNK